MKLNLVANAVAHFPYILPEQINTHFVRFGRFQVQSVCLLNVYLIMGWNDTLMKRHVSALSLLTYPTECALARISHEKPEMFRLI